MVKLYIINTQSAVCGALTREYNIVVGHKDIKIDFLSFSSPSFEWIHIPFNMCELPSFIICLGCHRSMNRKQTYNFL